jgi:chromosomal replication initiator protein
MICEPKIWHEVLCRLQEEVPDFAYVAWIHPLAVKLDDDRVVLGCPSSFHRDRVRIQFHELLEQCLLEALASEAPAVKTPSIELVSMSEFAAMPGHEIDVSVVEEPAREEQLIAAEHRMRSVGVQTTAQLAAGGERGLTHRGYAIENFDSAAARSRDALSGHHLGAVPLGATSTPSPRKNPTAANAGASHRPDARSRAKRDADDSSVADQHELPFSFESFVVGPCNALAREAALALARTRQRSLNLVYLGGDSGMGKTHLARATAAEARRYGLACASSLAASGSGAAGASSAAGAFGAAGASRAAGAFQARGAHARGGGPTVVYTSAENFTSDFVSAMRNGRGEQFRRRYRGSIGLLVVEDIQLFSGRVKTQLELFHTLQHVLDAGGRVLLTGDRSPRELSGLDDRVRSQVGQGFVAELEPPDAVVRRHILRSKAAAGGIRLPEDCLDLLVDASHGSVRDIESMLIQVVTTSSLLGRSIDLDLTQDAIALKASASSVLPARTVAVSEIVRIVAAFFGKRPEALASKSRRRDVLVPRQLAMYLAHRYTDASFAEIGRGLGRGHPSVRNAIERIERHVLENAPVRYQVEALSERIDSTLKEPGSTSPRG